MNPPYSSVLFIHGNCREMLAAAIILSRIGPQVHLASEGACGLEMAEDHFYDLIVLDGQTRDLPSLDVFRCLSRENRQLTLVVTSSLGGTDRTKNRFRGALDVIDKPVSPMKMVAMICELLIKRYESQIEPAHQMIVN